MCKLTIELVPQSVWKRNLRSDLSTSDWDRLRRYCYREAGYRCEICGGKGSSHPVECHEIWDFNDDENIQTLTGVIALCPMCHSCKHIGFASVSGRRQMAFKQLCKVNGWDEEKAEDYVAECFELWNLRSEYDWDLDVSWAEYKLDELKGN